MARTSNNGGESKTTKTAPKAPARRRTDKPRPAAANDSTTTVVTSAVTLAGANDTLNPAEVQRRAYELYVRRGCCDGYDKEDWYEAERQLKQQH